MQISHGCLWLSAATIKFRNSVDRNYCAMENKSGKCAVLWLYSSITLPDISFTKVKRNARRLLQLILLSADTWIENDLPDRQSQCLALDIFCLTHAQVEFVYQFLCHLWVQSYGIFLQDHKILSDQELWRSSRIHRTVVTDGYFIQSQCLALDDF